MRIASNRLYKNYPGGTTSGDLGEVRRFRAHSLFEVGKHTRVVSDVVDHNKASYASRELR
jgi:uncharacterized protein (DUF779 family)